MARCWMELPADSRWADVRLASVALNKLGYTTEELRGTGNVLLRLPGSRLEVSELWRVQGQG